jgi:hypothetical protein
VRSLRVPEVEYIGRGRARAPHQFGCRYRSLRQPPRPKEGSSCCKAPAPQPLRRPAWSRHR